MEGQRLNTTRVPYPMSDSSILSSILQPSIIRVRGRYRVGKLLGSGTHGNVYSGRDIKTGLDVAIKLEPVKARNSWLSNEHAIYKALSNVPGFPAMHWYGTEAPYNVMVLDRLDRTLEEAIYKSHDDNLVFSLADQMLSRLESLHERSYIHRDVKPSSFMTGMGEKSSQVFLIDFGLAQPFRNPSTRQHVSQMSGLKTVGTIVFTSISSHLGQTQSRRDDLEALMYTIVYLYRGCLPWQDGLMGDSVEERGAAVLEKKIASAETLCLGLPAPFHTFAQYIRSLNFDQKPQYNYLHTLLAQCLGNSAPDSVRFVIKEPTLGKISSPPTNRV